MMKHTMLCAVLVMGLALPAMAGSTRDDDIHRIQSAADVFHDIIQTPENSIPLGLAQSAACIAIIPGEKHFAFVVGGKYGKGLVTCRTGNTWSAPAFVMISGGSFGFQIGGSSTDLILIFKNRNGLKKLLSDKFKIGGDATAAAGPVGRNAGASTDIELHAEILTYSRSRGLFAGISLDGAVFEPDEDGDIALYGEGVGREDILDGKASAPQEAAALLKEITTYARS
ncbi:MAG TPA: lipid-binding SYLF domain-containing protein [Candidatus Acidoferrales bacterium]|nr:lipid-binding SYLF domain-containing protein [Candidatus Acidoferrales bacterium]